MLLPLEQAWLILACMVVSHVSDDLLGPEILTAPDTFRAHVSTVVLLPCNVSALADSVLLWKQGSRIIFAGEIKVRRDERFAKVGNSLRISGVEEKDDGEYTCEVETKDKHNPKSVTHRLTILQSPTIFTSSSQANLTVIKGSTVVLNCGASGNPEPAIRWSRRNRNLAGLDHNLSGNGTILSLENITSSHAGRYTCTADNGVGNPVREDIVLTVLYRPSAVAERATVLAGEDCPVELVCNVGGFPAPAVQWYRGTMLLVPADTLAMLSRGGRHILSFSQFQFGETGTTSRFTCSATSPLGLAEADFSVIGAPGKPAVSSNVTEMVASKYRIEWTTPSYSHVVEHALIYKQVKDEKSPSILKYGENKLKIPNMDQTSLNCSSRSSPIRQEFTFILDKLEPVTRYNVRLAARNEHGWSELSAPVAFKTSRYLVQPPQESQILPLSAACQHEARLLLLASLLVAMASNI